MPRPDRLALVDTLRDGSVSFAPPSPHGPLDRPIPGAGAPRPVRASIAVGPGRAAIEAPALIRGATQGVVSAFPIQPGNVSLVIGFSTGWT